MADLRLTVDDSGLSKLESRVAKLSNKEIKLGVSGGSAKNLEKATNNAEKLKNVLSTTSKLDENGKLLQYTEKLQSGMGRVTTEMLKYDKAGNAIRTTTETQTSALAKYEQQLDQQVKTLMRASKLQKQGLSGFIDQKGLGEQVRLLSELEPGTLSFEKNYRSISRAITGYEVAASNASYANKELIASTRNAATEAAKADSNLSKQDSLLNKTSKLKSQGLAPFANMQAIRELEDILKNLDTRSPDFAKNYNEAARALARYEVEASNAAYAHSQLIKANKEAEKTAEASYKASKAKNKEMSKAEDLEFSNLNKKKNILRDIDSLESKSLKNFIDKNQIANIKDAVDALSIKDTDFSKKYTTLSGSLKDVIANAQKAAYAQKEIDIANKKNLLSIDNIKESMGTAAIRTVEWAVSMGALYGAFNGVKSLITTSSAISDQMTNIKMVTGASNDEIKSMLTNYQGIATELSSTTSQVAASAEVWLRQGRSIADTNSLIETSTVLSKVGFMDSATAAQMLTSAINGYGIEAKDAMSVVDKMSAIDVAAATSTQDLALAMAQTASGAKIAGVSMDELLSYVATIADVTQASGDTIGVSLKTIFSRINGVKLGSLTDGEGEDISRVETVLKQYGITLRDTNGTAKATGDILDELSVKWKTLTGLEKSEVATQFAGVHQKEKFLVLMENYNKALNYQEIASESAGSAMKKMNIWQQTTEAATQRLTGQWEILSTKMVDSNFTKGIIGLGTLGLEALNTDLGQLAIKATGSMAALVTLVSLFEKLKTVMTGFSETGVGAIVTAPYKGIKDIFAASKEYSATKKIVAETGVAFSEAAVSQAAFTEGSIAAGVAANGLKGGVAAAGASLAAFATTPVGAVVLGVAALTAGFMALEAFTQDYDETLSDLTKTNEEYATNVEKINSLRSESASLEDQIYRKQQSGATVSNDNDLAILVSKNEQLEAQISSLETINQLSKQQASNDAHSLINWTSEQSELQYNESSDVLAPSNPVMLTKPGKVQEYAQMISNVEDQINSITGSYNQGKISAEDYNKQFEELSKKQSDYAKTANEMANAVNEQAKSLDLSSEAGKADYDTVVAMNKALKEANKLSGLTSKEDSIVGGVQTGSSAAADAVVDLDGYSNAVKNLGAGLQKGVTDSDQFYEALSKIYGDNPPTNLSENLKTLTSLFGDGEDAAAQMLSVLQNGYLEAGKLNMSKLQSDFHLSQGAVETLMGRVAEMGLLLPNAINSSTIANINAMGNGLGLASEESVALESEIASLYNAVKNGTDLGAAKATLQDYLSGLNLTEDQVNGILANWDYLFAGLKESTITAFSGLQGNTAIQDAANSVSQTFTQTLSNDMSGNHNEVTQISFDAAVDTTALENSVREQMVAAGGYTDEQISQYQAEYANRQIQLNLNAIVEAEVDQIIPAGDANDKITAGIQAAYDSTTHSFAVSDVQANISGIKVEGVDNVETQITSAIQGINTKTDTALDLKVTANTDGAKEATAEIGKPEDKTITAKADTAAARAAFDQLIATEYKTVIVNEQQGTVVPITDTTKNVYVNEIQSNAAAGNMGTYANNATGSVNIDTGQVGTMSVVGEEGEETLLRKGKLSFIGTKGAEIIPIQDGDTILPADITKRIKSGQIPMYAQGKYSVTANNTGLYGNDVWDYRNQSSIWSGIAANPPEDEEAKKAYEANKDAFEKEYKYIKHLKEMGELSDKDYYAWLDKINKQYFAGKNDCLDDYREHEEEVYKFLKEQEQDRLDGLKTDYEAVTSAVENIIDGQIDAIKGQNDLADAYEKVSDAKEKVNNLKGQNTVRTYTEGGGWKWSVDQNAIDDAQEELDDAQKDYDVAVLEDYKDKWTSIADNYKNEQNNLIAQQILGADYEKAILDGRLDVLTDFANKYSTILSDLSQINDEESPVLTYDDKSWTLSDPYAGGVKNLYGDSGTINTLGSTEKISANILSNLSAIANVSSNTSPTTSSADTYLTISNLSLENVTDFDSFITEAKQYAKVNSPKR